MPVNIPGLLANMSNSLGAYLRPSRPPLPFTSSNSNGHGYYDDPNMPKDPWRKQGTRRRFIIRWCLLPALLISLLFLWFTRGAQKKPEPPEPPKTPDPPPPIPTVDPFENCARVIEEMGIPSVENITKLQPASASSTMTTTNGKPYKSHKLPSPVGSDDPRKWAREVSPAELMEMVESGEHPGPRILHQSWKPGPLPPHFERWSAKWKKQLDETWLYVLWRDSDNRRLVERHYPTYLEAYDSLPREIYRADMVRNIYMHYFGGVYADLDLVPIRSLPESIPILTHPTPPPVPIAYLGHMGDDNYEHSIPNAFMVSTTPGHPFWLRPLEFVKEHQYDEAYSAQPEGLTGPVALRTCIQEWTREREVREGAGEFAEVRVLPNERIYPFSWYESPLAHHCVCRLHSPHFNETRCHWLYPDAWTITYWTHSWGF